MKLDIDLSEQAEAWYRRKAEASGKPIEDCIVEVIENWLGRLELKELKNKPIAE